MIRYLSLGAILVLSGCVTPPSADRIISRAIEMHGGTVLAYAEVRFRFREYAYVIQRQGGRYSYQRQYMEEGQRITEILDNDGITRAADGQIVALSDEEARSIATPLNSVPYFALLPFNLTDNAVRSRYLGTSEIKGEPYHEIEVTFHQESGGQDFEDRYVYWFHKQRRTMDYLAYTFHSGDGGTRFREAFNVRTINGVRFADYRNYVSDALMRPEDAIESYDDVLKNGNVRLLSEVILEDIFVMPLEGSKE